MKHALSAAIALGLGIGLAVTAQAHGTYNRQAGVPGTDMQAGASEPARHAAATQQSRRQIMHTQRMLKAQGFYKGRIDGVMNRQTQLALTRFHHQPKGMHRVAALQPRQHHGMNRMAALHKARKPAGQEIGVGSSRPNDRNAMSGSTSNITPTPAAPTAPAPNAGGNNDQNR